MEIALEPELPPTRALLEAFAMVASGPKQRVGDGRSRILAILPQSAGKAKALGLCRDDSESAPHDLGLDNL